MNRPPPPTERTVPAWLRPFAGNRDLAMLFSGQVVSQAGDSMYEIGLLWLVLELTASEAATGLVAMLTRLPALLLGLFGGVLVDAFDRRRMMLLSDLLRALAVAVLAALLLTGRAGLPTVIVIAFAVASFATFFNPARDALLPALVPRERLLGANALMQVSAHTSYLLGPALAAAVVAVAGVPHLFTVDAVTFLVSFVAVAAIRHRAPPRPLRRGPLAGALAADFGEVIAHLRGDRRLTALILLTAVNNLLIMGPAVVGIPIYVRRVLAGGATGYALVEASLGAGTILGGLVAPRLLRRFGLGRVLLVTMVFDGATCAAVALLTSLEALMALIFLHALGIPLIVVARTTLIQRWVPERRLGRVFAVVNVSVLGMTAVSAGAAGWVAGALSPGTLFVLFGAGAGLCGVVGWTIRGLREA